MLSLTDGFSVDGVDFFRDDEKKEIFYYLPTKVEVGKKPNGKPEFQFVLYQSGLPINGKQSGGGFLLFTTVLTEDPQIIGPKAIAQAQQILQDEAGPGVGQVPTPVIRPANFIGGSAKLLIAKSNGQLVNTVELGRPALFGQNSVSVMADMPLDGAQMFAAVLQAGGNIAAIEYNLEFDVRLPSATITAHIEASRIRDVKATLVDEVVTEESWGSTTTTRNPKRSSYTEILEEHSLVELEIKAGSSQTDLDDKVVEELRDFALGAMDKFINEEWLKVGGMLTPEQLQDEHLKKIKEEFTKNFDMNLTQSDVIARPYAPSAMVDPSFIGGNIDDYLTIVDTLAHPFFQRLEVEIMTSFDFDKYDDYVHSIVANLNYSSRGDDGRTVAKTQSFTFTKDNHAPQTFTTAKGKATDNDYDITAEVHYKAGPVQMQRLFQTTSSAPAQVIDVGNPGEIDVNFGVSATAFTGGLEAVEVELAYQDRANGVQPFTEAIALEKDKPAATIRRPVFVTNLNPFNYRYTHVFSSQRITSPWIEAAAGTRNLRIPTPFKDNLVVDILASADWAEVQSIVVNLAYEDDANDIRAQQSFVFLAEDAGKARNWTVKLADPDQRRVAVSETQQMKNGAVRVLPRREIQADGTVVVVGNAPGGVMKLSILAEDLAMGTDIKRVSVDLEYADAAHGVLDRHRAILRNTTDTSVWTVALIDPAKIDYSYTVEYTLTNGDRVTGTPKTGRFLRPDDVLFLEAPDA